MSRFHPVALKAEFENKFDFEGILFKGVNSDLIDKSGKFFYSRSLSKF